MLYFNARFALIKCSADYRQLNCISLGAKESQMSASEILIDKVIAIEALVKFDSFTPAVLSSSSVAN